MEKSKYKEKGEMSLRKAIEASKATAAQAPQAFADGDIFIQIYGPKQHQNDDGSLTIAQAQELLSSGKFNPDRNYVNIWVR